jgi:glucosylceramidase
MTHSAEPSCLRGELGPDGSVYAAAWAHYIAKWIQAYGRHGIPIRAVTVQNEPEFPAPWEACSYSATNMTDFVAYHLGPRLASMDADAAANDENNNTSTTKTTTTTPTQIWAFDHNKDHVNTWMQTMLNGTARNSPLAREYVKGTGYHWYAGGMDRLLDGALGIANLHRLRADLKALNLSGADEHIVLGTEACHCPSTGYAGGDITVYWSRAERYAHAILADLAAGSQGWVEWNLILDSIGGPNHLGNLCDASLLSVPHRAANATTDDIAPLPDFEYHPPANGRITGDNRTREELNALGFPAQFLDHGVAVQPLYHYMGHISRYVRPGSRSLPALIHSSLGAGDIFRIHGAAVALRGQHPATVSLERQNRHDIRRRPQLVGRSHRGVCRGKERRGFARSPVGGLHPNNPVRGPVRSNKHCRRSARARDHSPAQ